MKTVSLIENLLIEHPDVAEVCVLTLQSFGEDSRYVAFVALKESAAATRDVLCGYCTERCNGASDSLDVIILPALPRSPMGTVQRRRLFGLATAHT